MPSDRETLAALQEAVRRLEDRLAAVERSVQPVQAIGHPYHQAGCVCPAGAEAHCGSSGCPRQAWRVT
jgi:hypothetical protein